MTDKKWNSLTPAERTAKLTVAMPEADWKPMIQKMAVKQFEELSSLQQIAVRDEIN